MGRRDFIAAWLTALLLSLFPWLRTSEGFAVAERVAGAMADSLTAQQILALLRADIVAVKPQDAQRFDARRLDPEGVLVVDRLEARQFHVKVEEIGWSTVIPA